ncbi:MAG TPA: hypothetical protein DD640_10290 [Clostridiales bacterium]|nr:hypothetical protein [Clostridiales bacterium]
MNQNSLYVCKVKIENIGFTISLDASFFQSVSRPIALHNHAAYEVHVIKCGSYVFNIDGREITLDDGGSCIIGPGVYHSKGNALTGNARRFIFKFEYAGKNGKTSEIAVCLNRIGPFCLFRNSGGEVSLAEALIAEIQNKPLGYATNVDNLASQLMLAVLRDVAGLAGAAAILPRRPAVRPTDFDDNRAAAIDGFFALNYSREVHVPELAGLLNLSIRQLNRVLLKLYGVTFKQKLAQIRVNAAREMLKNSGMTIAKIAENTGFGQTGSFSAAFRKLTGLTPEQYRSASRRQAD